MLQPVPRPTAHVQDPDVWREQLVAHLPLIRRVAASVCRQHGGGRQQEEELFSDVCLKLLEHDCAVLRQYRGECNFHTYLRVVIGRVLLDQRVRAWGKWRPSVRARALGESAVLLERLMVRDGLQADTAVAVVTQQAGSRLSRDEVVRLSATIRPRRRVAPVALDDIAEIPDPRGVVSPAGALELHRHARAVSSALGAALQSLAATEVQLLSWRFRDGRTVAEIARATGRNQKRLYRTYESLFERLRLALERAGVRATDVRDLLGHVLAEVGGVFGSVRPAA